MTPEPLHALISPLVTALGRQTEFTVLPASAGPGLPPGEYEVSLNHKAGSGESRTAVATRDERGRLHFTHASDRAGEIWADIHFPSGRWHRAGSIFVADADLAARVPLRGDLHQHTWYSDGRSSPSELLEAAVGRHLDFVAVTDHDNWSGSQEARAQAEAQGLPLTVLSGEEVTFDRGHIVAVGTIGGVAEARRDGPYAAELRNIEAEFEGKPLAGGVSAASYARAVWSTRKVRELGGLAILAHPFWVAAEEFHLDRRIAAQLARDGELDAVELLGDVEFEENMLAIAQHLEMLQAGIRLPVLGNSDTHGIEHTLGRYWTTVFSQGDRETGILAAIKDGRCVACTGAPGENLRIYGPLDLVEYAYFLHRAHFPLREAGTVARGAWPSLFEAG